MAIYIKLSTNKNANALQGLVDIIEELDILGEQEEAIVDVLVSDGIDFEVSGA